MSILLYGCITWTLTKRMEKKAWQQMGLLQVLLVPVRVDIGVMAMKGYPTFTKAPIQKQHHLIQFTDTCWGVSYPSANVQLAYLRHQPTWRSDITSISWLKLKCNIFPFVNPISRICLLHFCRGVRPAQWVSSVWHQTAAEGIRFKE